MTRKKSRLNLNKQKGCHRYQKSGVLPKHCDSPDPHSQVDKSPKMLNFKRTGWSVFSPFKSPISKRFKVATYSSPFFKSNLNFGGSPLKSPNQTPNRSGFRAVTPNKSPYKLTYTRGLWNTSLFCKSPYAKRGRTISPNQSPVINKKTPSQKPLFQDGDEKRQNSDNDLFSDFTPIIQEEESSEKDALVETLLDLIPKVIHELRQAEIDPTFLESFFKQVVNGIFPLKNMAFLDRSCRLVR